MSEFKFNINSEKLDLTNALALAEASVLVYKDWDEVEDVVKNEWNFLKFKFFEGEHHTQAFMAAKDDLLLLTFRGTEPSVLEDWKTDSKIKLIDHPNGRIHFGFNQSLDSIWQNVKDTLIQWNQGQPIWLTGHSLGGALGTLAADRLDRDNITIKGLYTYGQPMVADKKFVKKFNQTFGERCCRFVNDQDLVTKVPGIPPYKHISKECYLDMNGKLHLTNILWIRWMDYLNGVAGRSSEFASHHKFNNPGSIDDHGMKFYIKGIEQNLSSDKTNTSFAGHINS